MALKYHKAEIIPRFVLFCLIAEILSLQDVIHQSTFLALQHGAF